MVETTESALAWAREAVADLPPEVADAVAVDPTRLSDALAACASVYCLWALRAAAAQSDADAAKEALARVEADADAEVRCQMAQDGVKVTEAQVAQAVRRHPAVQAAEDEARRARARALILARVEQALRLRAEMLTHLASHQRLEARIAAGPLV
jgi:lipopolysaccharide biosynthesis regulator YciM